MKRWLAALLCLALLCGTTACFRAPGVPETPLGGVTTASSVKPTTTAKPTAATTTVKPTAGTTTTTATAPTDPDAPPVVAFTSYPATGWTTDSLIVRDEASPDGKYIGGLAAGHDVTVLEKVGGWYRISYLTENGWTDQVYINALYVTAQEPERE